MDVNNLGQNTVGFNQYNSNSSDYSQISEQIEIQPVHKIEKQSSEENNYKNKEYDKKDLDNALKRINNFLKDENTHAEYSVHKDLGTIMIKIIDENTKQVLLEVPPQKILDMVASMCKQVGIIDKKA